jgi:hypothetical protein
MFHPRPLGRMNKRILKNKSDNYNYHENEEKQSTIILFILEQLEVLFKMNRFNFIELVKALKRGSSKNVGFKLVKSGNFDGVQNWKVVDV